MSAGKYRDSAGKSRDGNYVTKQVLKEIISENTTPLITKRDRSTERRVDVDKIKLGEAILYLERKVERQNAEIVMLTDQLSQESKLREDVLLLYNDEKERHARASQLLANANKSIAQLKKRVAAAEAKQAGESNLKEDYEMKLNKYRDIVRKKDQLLIKSQQKNQELGKVERMLQGNDSELKSLRESFMKLKAKEEVLLQENESLKKKEGDLAGRLKEKEEALLMATEKLRRLDQEYEELNQMYHAEVEEAKKIEVSMKDLLDTQMLEISLMRKEQEERSNSNSDRRQLQPNPQPTIQINVYKNEIRRVFNLFLKDANLRKKLQKTVIEIMEEMENSFNCVLQQISK